MAYSTGQHGADPATAAQLKEQNTMANTYYATCDNNGLISARIEAESVREANAILALQCPVYAERAPSDLEDEIEGLPSDYDEAMAIVAERCTLVSAGSNVHGDWQIWTVNPIDAAYRACCEHLGVDA